MSAKRERAKFLGIVGEGDERKVEFELRKGEQRLADYNMFIQGLLSLAYQETTGRLKKLTLEGLHAEPNFTSLSSEVQNAIVAYYATKGFFAVRSGNTPYQTGEFKIAEVIRTLNAQSAIDDDVKMRWLKLPAPQEDVESK